MCDSAPVELFILKVFRIDFVNSNEDEMKNLHHDSQFQTEKKRLQDVMTMHKNV